MREEDLKSLEARLLLEAVYEAWGYDFRGYSERSLMRQLDRWLSTSGFETFSAAQGRLLRSREVFESLLAGLTIHVTEMFRDPEFFRAIRELVVPHLKTHPFVKIWHAGCASGEEAYSLAILLAEEGLAGRFHLYATDISPEALLRAEEGVLPMAAMQQFTESYIRAGGRAAFSDYYVADGRGAKLRPALREPISFASHNLAGDASFGEMNMVLCRNVLIYFDEQLRESVLELLDESLLPGGFLCLGTKESLERNRVAGGYEPLVRPLNIYQKRYVSARGE